MTHTHRLAAAAAGMLLLTLPLSGCLSASISSGQSSDAASDPTASPDQPPDDTTGHEPPAECADLELTAGATLDPAALGECVSTALVAFGSGRESIHDSETDTEVEFQYDPDFEFHTDDGTSTITYLDGTLWVDTGSGPIKGDVDSDNPDEQMAGFVADMFRIFADPAVTSDLVASAPGWKVTEPESVELGNGETVQAYRITSTGSFTWRQFPVNEFVLWYGEDWYPVASEGNLAFWGTDETVRQTYYDLGEPVEIAAPTG